MQHLNVEKIYSEIVLLSDTERDTLFNRMKNEFYQDTEIVAYTTDGSPLSCEQYQRRINDGIEQCVKGESVSLEDLSKELGYNYADL
jgi:hypothetical protein